jgi:hypothetical protein
LFIVPNAGDELISWEPDQSHRDYRPLLTDRGYELAVKRDNMSALLTCSDSGSLRRRTFSTAELLHERFRRDLSAQNPRMVESSTEEAKIMIKALLAGAVVIGAVVVAKRHVLSRDGFDIERFIERMPDNAPPKWAFQNITAIRENTDRILELLDGQRKTGTGEKSAPLDEGAA